MKRIMIVGGSGAGKSTLAEKLSGICNIPVSHVDKMYHAAGWAPRSYDEVLRLSKDAAGAEEWIIDGNFHPAFHDRLERADTVIYLDISTAKRFWRVLRRTYLSYGKVRPDNADGCPERWHLGLLMVALRFRHRDGRQVRQIFGEAQKKHRCYHVKSQSDLGLLLQDAAGWY